MKSGTRRARTTSWRHETARRDISDRRVTVLALCALCTEKVLILVKPKPLNHHTHTLADKTGGSLSLVALHLDKPVPDSRLIRD